MKYDYSQLLFDVQKKSNITVSNIRELKILKDEIEFVTNTVIGFNTLRRMFGFLEKREPNISTLDKIAKYLGYSSFSNYKNHKTNYNDWYFQQYLLQISKLKTIDSNQIREINQGIMNENNIVFLGYFINFFIKKNNIKVLQFIFQNVHFNQISNTQLHKFGIIISLILSSLPEKKALKIYEALIVHDNFRNNIPLLHIDYANLNSRYLKIIQLIDKNNANSSDVLYTNLMYKYKSFYIDNLNLPLDIKKPKEFDSFHYTLKGRYYGIHLLHSKEDIKHIKNEILLECKKNKVSFFLIEIIPALVFIEEIYFLEELLNKYYEEVFDGEVWSSETTNAIYLIGLANVNLFTNKPIIAKRNLDLIELDKVEIGYYEYLSLFYYLTQLKISFSEKNKTTNELSKKHLNLFIKKTKFIRFEEVAASYTIQ
jgi:hypothetical protein